MLQLRRGQENSFHCSLSRILMWTHSGKQLPPYVQDHYDYLTVTAADGTVAGGYVCIGYNEKNELEYGIGYVEIIGMT